MDKVLFTHSYFLNFDPKQKKAGQPYPPLGTITAAAYIRASGYEVSLHDNMFKTSAAELVPALEKEKPRYLVIYDDGFNYLTKMCLTNMREAAFSLIESGKKNGCTVIVSSSDATDHAAAYLNKGSDFIIRGEAEVTLLELLNELTKNNGDINSVKGIMYRSAEGTVQTEPRKVMQDLDAMPLPAWDLIDMAAYKTGWIDKSGYFSLNIATTRGCPYQCNWCAKPIYGNRYTVRSPENVISEIKMLSATYQMDHIWFCDDIFGLKPGWIETFAQLIEQNKLKIRYKVQSRADILLKGEMIKNLAASGCQVIWMGVESGSQTILDAMDKGITMGQVAEATEKIKRQA